jgi:hypothetical protein
VCDCCDGSDEINTPFPIKCANRCGKVILLPQLRKRIEVLPQAEIRPKRTLSKEEHRAKTIALHQRYHALKQYSPSFTHSNAFLIFGVIVSLVLLGNMLQMIYKRSASRTDKPTGSFFVFDWLRSTWFFAYCGNLLMKGKKPFEHSV